MKEPWDNGLDEDDFVEGIDDEEDDELGIDYTARHGGAAPLEDVEDKPRRLRRGPNLAKVRTRRCRIRAMSERMAAKNPGVISILVTRTNGSQVLLVRR